MNSYDRIMPELFRIVGGALRLDVKRVRNYTDHLADKLEKEGDHRTARRLRQLLAETDRTLRPAGTSALAIPVDTESRFPLVERAQSLGQPVILSSTAWEVIREFISVAKSHAILEAEGVNSPLSLMLYGPPGCGKTLLANHIAQDLDLEMFTARLDGLISSYLGSTSKNIRALFQFASERPCVLFLDEFDAIAKLRGDTLELGELKRVVNSFLQNLDGLEPHTVVIAATNHQELLDRAVWRRFAYRLELPYPSRDDRRQMWSTFLGDLHAPSRDLAVLADLSDGFSGSDIREAALRLRRQEIALAKPARLQDAFRALRQLAPGDPNSYRFLSALSGSDPSKIASVLRARDPELYSFRMIARLLGCFQDHRIPHHRPHRTRRWLIQCHRNVYPSRWCFPIKGSAEA